MKCPKCDCEFPDTGEGEQIGCAIILAAGIVIALIVMTVGYFFR